MTDPPSGDITSHSCEECAEVTTAFWGVRWWSADPALIDDSLDDLPLFTPHAYRYLPAFLLRALETLEPDNLVTQFCLFNLSGDPSDDWYRKRIEQFTPEQRAVIVSFLRCVCDDARFERFHTDAAAALRDVWLTDNTI
jgi:hypothetical protein